MENESSLKYQNISSGSVSTMSLKIMHLRVDRAWLDADRPIREALVCDMDHNLLKLTNLVNKGVLKSCNSF